MNPIISELAGFVKSAESLLALRKRELRDACRKAIKETPEGQKVADGDLILGDDWDCPSSPTGKCAYDRENDPGDCDDCIFCHQPEERK